MEVDYENLLKDYLVETKELLDVSEQAILELEKGYRPDEINTIFRAIHTIKGNSAIFDLPSVTKLSHAFESYLNHFRKTEIPPSSDEIHLFLRCIDVLKEMTEESDGGKNKDIGEILDKLEEYLTKSKHAAEPGKNGKHAVASEEPQTAGLYLKPKATTVQNTNGKVGVPKSYIERAESERRFLLLIRFRSGEGNLEKLSVLESGLGGQIEVLKTGSIPYSSSGTNGNGRMEEIHFAILLSSMDRERLIESSSFPLISVTSVSVPKASVELREASKIESNSSNILSSETKTESGKNKDNPSESYLKIPLQLLDHMINLAGETIVVRNQLLQRIESYEDPTLLAIVRNLSQLITSSQETVMRTRLQKLEALYKKIPRLIHDLERTTGKEVELILEGGEVELDKNLIDSISDPITHMIRNSVDHGLESPSDRIAAGKPRKGTVILSATLRGGNVILKVEDDGRGLNYRRIKEKAIEKGLLTEEEAERKSDEELSELIFSPGFSTAQAVSSTSGRGVGMDVVKMNFQKAGGSVSINSTLGKGTSVVASLPQTLSIINCQMVRSAGMLFAIPQQNISELILFDKRLVSSVEKKDVYQLRGHLLPILDLRQVFELSNESEDQNRFIVVVHTEKHKFGLLVEEIENPEEIVVKPLSKDLAKLNLYTGAAILGDGNVALIIDVAGIAKFLKLQPNVREELRSEAKKDEKLKEHYLLFSVRSQLFGLNSNQVLRIELIDPKNIEKIMDREVMQYRGEIVELCRLDSYFKLKDKDHRPENTMILFQTAIGKKGILVNEIYNVIEEISAFTENEDQSSGVVGNGIVLEETVIVINPITILSKITKNLLKEAVSQ
ncbi:chemotaxis protein CheW [Leptospira wolffii]|uniref:histidine kinase n=1 Tax=Leptospira wolffii TaxID=409998 RepID=A0ABV5BP22_9LEPT